MATSKITRRGALIAAILASAAVMLPLGSQAVAKTTPVPRLKASTGPATHVLATSALLSASITPTGVSTSYYFQYGPTTTYGSQTPTASVGSGTTKVKVGQSISKLVTGVTYHFRVAAVAGSGAPVFGRDRTFTAGATSKPKFELAKAAEVVAGSPFLLSGTLGGIGGTPHEIVLQASPYPYAEPFKTISAPELTGAGGRFSFHVSKISSGTAFRVITLDAFPVYSSIETVRAAVKVALNVRTSTQVGLVRLYGTVAPAAVGAQVLLQVHEAIKPGSVRAGSEATGKFATQFVTVVKRGGKTFSRFSIVARVGVAGRYRAVVKLPPGPLATGYSPTLVLKAAPAPAKKRSRKA